MANDQKFDLGAITGLGAAATSAPTMEERHEAHRRLLLQSRVLLLQSDAMKLAGILGAISECPDQIKATARREMQLRVIEADMASCLKFVGFFQDDIAAKP